ncbi:uncharacterized protein B0H18DRAFT_1205552 [Fomitopsis serialis]|uniref:uncharacterized protein n=1 Tax=Fomitopsis serialis TaxID=139415 RepID=UPI002008D230|nr:uncharacterized protein B0H18DRAFT_1205552 [Neoantrodia serialis]KAH9938286.1 hypothetical protein B0H18DRAFT_1205552 [Neoantrodia serialis]
MKFATEEELAAHNRATIRGALEGTAAGLALSVPGSIFLHRRWPAYRALPIQLKAMFCIFVTAPLYAIQAERRGVKAQEESRWKRLGTEEKLKDWAVRNHTRSSWDLGQRYGACWWYCLADRHQSATQKIVQAAAEHRPVDHTWKGMVQEFEDEERAREQYQLMHAPAPAPSSSSS